jgi:hypothetical protein
MARGHDLHKARLEALSRLQKELARTAKFRCEWCSSKDALSLHDTAPDQDPVSDALLFLCERCRALASDDPMMDPRALRACCDALWSEREVVKNELARLLARSGERWAREAVEAAWLDEELKARLLGAD